VVLILGTTLAIFGADTVENRTKYNNMKKLNMLAVLGGLVAVQQSFALPIPVNVTWDSGVYRTWPGGEFTINSTTATAIGPGTDAAFNALYNAYAPVATHNFGIESFCISTSIDVQNNPLFATLTPDVVTKGTAWLYKQFAQGTLAGYDYTPGTGRALSAQELQNAIWELQGQHVYYTAGINTFLIPAENAFGGTLAGAQALDGGAQGVDELLMFNANGTESQPMLVLVPDGGLTAMLLGLGMLGITGTRRFIKK